MHAEAAARAQPDAQVQVTINAPAGRAHTRPEAQAQDASKYSSCQDRAHPDHKASREGEGGHPTAQGDVIWIGAAQADVPGVTTATGAEADVGAGAAAGAADAGPGTAHRS